MKDKYEDLLAWITFGGLVLIALTLIATHVMLAA